MASRGLQALERRLERNPASLAFARLADGYRKRGEIDEAIRICKSGISRHGDYVTGRLILARCYFEQEKFNEAAEEFARVCAVDRRNAVAVKMMAEIFARQGREDKAGDLYAYLRLMDPENETFAHLALKFPGGGTTDLFDIIGTAPPSMDRSIAMEATREARRGGESLPTEAVAAPGMTAPALEVDGGVIELSGEGLAKTVVDEAPGAAAGAGVTGDEVSARLDALFEDAMKAPAQAHEPPAVSPEEAADLAASLPPRDEPFSLDEIQNAQTMAVSGEMLRAAAQEAPAVDEAKDRISSLMGEEAIEELSVPEAPAPVAEAALESPAGDDVADRISSLLGGDGVEELNAPAAPVAETEAAKELPGSDDIAGRIEELFEPQAGVAAAPADEAEALPQVSSRSTISDLDLSVAPTVEMRQTELLDLARAEVSGDDVTSRIEELFGPAPETTILGPAAQELPAEAQDFAAMPQASWGEEEDAGGAQAAKLADFQGQQPQTRQHDSIADAQTAIADRSALGLGDAEAVDEPAEMLNAAQVIDEAAVSGHDVSVRIEEMFGAEEEAAQTASEIAEDTDRFDLAAFAEETIMTPVIANRPDGVEAMEDTLRENELHHDDTETLTAGKTVAQEDTIIDQGREAVAGVYQMPDAASPGQEAAAQPPSMFEEDAANDARIDEQSVAARTGDEPLQEDTVRHDVGASDTLAADATLAATLESGDDEIAGAIDETADPSVDIQEAPGPEGRDIAERLDQIFGEEESLILSHGIPEGESEERVGEGFYTLSGEDAKLAGSGGVDAADKADLEPVLPEMIADAEEPGVAQEGTVAHRAGEDLLQDDTVLHPLHEGDTMAIAPEDRQAELLHDETVAMGSEERMDDGSSPAGAIPDHVLTPTLADIYYQQGQAQMAIQIYERLLQRDGGNERISRRLEEIRAAVARGETPHPPCADVPVKAAEKVEDSLARNPVGGEHAPKARARRRRSARPKPLEGIRIQKRVRDRLKKTRRKPTA